MDLFNNPAKKKYKDDIGRNGHVAVVDLLLQAGVPVDATDHKVQ